MLFLLLLLFQEKITLTTAINPPNVLEFQIIEVRLATPKTIGTNAGEWSLVVIYVDNNDRTYVDKHEGVFNATTNPNGADVLVIALNKANLNPATGGKSLNRRALEHLQGEGKIPAGSVVGTPQ